MSGAGRVLVAATALLCGAVLWPDIAAARSPETLLDAATRCRRRAKPQCVLDKADAALTQLGDSAGEDSAGEGSDAGPGALLKEALELRAEALAHLDRADDAVAACLTLLERDAAWHPASGADPRLVTAFDTARRQRLVSRLPTSLAPVEPPAPPLPDPATLLPEPTLHEPHIDPEDVAIPTRWRLSLGGGIAFIMPKTDKTFDLGPTAAFEIAYDIWGPLSIWGHLTLTLLSLDDRVAVEPGFARGLTVTSGVVGVMASWEVLHWLELVGAVGIGGGGFGVQDPGEAAGLAIHADVGMRFAFDRHLGIRLDAVPMLIVPFSGPAGPDGHISLMLRGEIRF